MIATLIDHDARKESFLIIIIQPDNLERMRKADPITLETKEIKGGLLPTPKYPARLTVVIAYEEDDFEINKLALTGEFSEVLRYIMRGYKFHRDIDGKEHAFTLNRFSRPEDKQT
ncbi:MAG TPA: hypothetical protein VGH83_05835 [Candidatus Acidoferrum sp.]|jgi:hypothetical protein